MKKLEIIFICFFIVACGQVGQKIETEKQCYTKSKNAISRFYDVAESVPVFMPCDGVILNIVPTTMDPDLELIALVCDKTDYRYQIYYVNPIDSLSSGQKIHASDIIGKAGKHKPENAKANKNTTGYFTVVDVKESPMAGALWLDPSELQSNKYKKCD